MDLPFSQACENNKQPILNVLQRWLTQPIKVFEIGAGTGQHAVFFAEHLPHITWQCGDLAPNLAGINAWLRAYPQSNLPAAVQFNMTEAQWPSAFEAVYSSNTAHIMPWPVTQMMLKGVAERLPKGGLFFLYGPFNYGGDFTSESNARFDEWLKHNNPAQGIRDFEKVNLLAEQAGLQLQEDNAMPANNRLLVWQKAT